MPSKIQLIPRGLLSALGIKGTGQNPTELGDGVLPVIDVREHYATNALEIVTATDNVQTVGDNVSIVVPQGEAWRIYSMMGQLNGTAGDTTKFFVGLRIGGNGQHIRLNTMQPRSDIVATETHIVPYSFPVPLVLPPGSNTTAQLQITMANSDQLRLTVCIERLLI